MVSKARSAYDLFSWIVIVAISIAPVAADGATKKNKHPVAPDAVPRAIPVVEEEVAPGKGPNILFILLDGLNDWCGPLGGHPLARTPAIDRLAAAGMTFTNAHCASALSNPSRTALLAGMNPWTSGIGGDDDDWRHAVTIKGGAVLPEHLRACGWFTAASGKIFHASPGGPAGRLTGWQGGRRGFELDHAWNERLPGPGVQMPQMPVKAGSNLNGLGRGELDWGPVRLSDDEMDDARVASWAAEFLQRKLDRPFFLAVGFRSPTPPWYVPQKYFDMFPSDKIGPTEKNTTPQEAQARLAGIAFADAMVGRLLEALGKSPHPSNTLIVLTSDRGWSNAVAGRQTKDAMLREEATRVPLIFFVPGLTKAGSTSSQPVSLVDVYPTLQELAGLPARTDLDGESLVPLLRDPATKRSRPAVTGGIFEGRPGYAVRSDRWRYIRRPDGREELYDHSTDSSEQRNVASLPASGDAKAALSAALPSVWKSPHRPFREVARDVSGDGAENYALAAGDRFDAKASPDITARSFEIEAEFEYNPELDRDATIITQGDPRLGWAVHLVAGHPAFTVNYDGLSATLRTEQPLASGHIILRALLGADGTLGINATGIETGARGFAPMEGGFPRQPEPGISVGRSFGPLSPEHFPDSSILDGTISRLRFTLLPK